MLHFACYLDAKQHIKPFGWTGACTTLMSSLFARPAEVHVLTHNEVSTASLSSFIMLKGLQYLPSHGIPHFIWWHSVVSTQLVQKCLCQILWDLGKIHSIQSHNPLITQWCASNNLPDLLSQWFKHYLWWSLIMHIYTYPQHWKCSFCLSFNPSSMPLCH